MPSTRPSRWRRPFLATATVFALLGAPRPAATQTRAYAFLPLVTANQAAVLDTSTNALLPAIATGAGPTGIAVSHDGRRAYVVNQAGNTVTVIDVATMTPAATIPVGNGPLTLAVSPDDRKAYVTRPAADVVTVLDLTTNTATGDIALPGLSPRGIAFTPDGQTAWVVGNTARRIDVATNTPGPGIALAGPADAVAVSGNGMTAWVTLPGLNAIQPVSTVLGGTTIAVGAAPSQIALSPDGTTLYVTNTASNTVSVVAVATSAVVATIPVGSAPVGVSFRMDGQRAYVTNGSGNTVSTIDTATRTVIASPAVGGSPTGLGGPFVTPPLIVPTGGPLLATADAELDAAGFRGYLPFLGGTFKVAGPVSITTSRHLSLLAPGGTIDTNLSGLDVLGDVSGPGALTLIGGGFLELAGTSTHGGTLVSHGFLVVDGTHPSPITLTSVSAQLRGSGTVGAVNVAGGIVSPGSSTLGPLHASQVTFAPGSGLGIAINGAVHSQLVVSGTTALNGAHLSVTELAAPTLGVPLIVVTNATGTFEDLPEGAELVVPTSTAYSARYRVSYVGGDGNDVTVTKLNDPPFFLGTIAAQTTSEGLPLVVPISVDDLNNTQAQLTVTATSSNQAIVPDATGLTVTGPPNRQLTITPAIGAHGDVTITLMVTDGIATTTTSFVLSVLERTYYLAEGATGPFFDTWIAIANPNPQLATFRASFLKANGTTTVQDGVLLAHQRTTIFVDTLPGLEDATFSTVVAATNGQPLVVERTMRWGASHYGAHTEKAAAGASRDWYFAEGSQGYFSTYFLLVNPQPTANVAHVTYFRENLPPLIRTYQLAARSRTTIDAGQDAELRNRSFGAHVAFDLAGAAERAMYFGTSPLWLGGHDSFGSPAPSTTWFLAEGATGNYFTTFVLLANPNDEPVDVTLTYLPASGIPVTRMARIPAGQRLTRNIALEDAALANAAVATQVTASLPIVVERSQYWGTPEWIEAHNSGGVTAAATRWALAEGLVGGSDGAQTYILLANTGVQPAVVTLTFLRTEGAPLVKTFSVAPTSRFNVAVSGPGSQVPELTDAAFGVRIDSTQPIVVERSLYWNADGVIWAAGTNATATPLP
jgi:YVTN family beta-propeller protein